MFGFKIISYGVEAHTLHQPSGSQWWLGDSLAATTIGDDGGLWWWSEKEEINGVKWRDRLPNQET